MSSDFSFNGAANTYRDHVINVLGYRIPNVSSADELIELARKLAVPPFEAALGWRTEPPFPGAAERPDEMPTGWRMICACRILDERGELGVIYMTLVSGRTTAVVVNAPGTLIPEEYLPISSR